MNLRHSPAFKAVSQSLDEPAIIACSGGVDSSALLALAAEARDAGACTPTVVAVDHRVRPTSAADVDAVARLAARFGLPFHPTTTSGAGARSEARLRDERYAALARIGQTLGIYRVITAHTRDDQVETILIRLLSGSGALASAGMRAEQSLETPEGTIVIVRPLLGTPRSELEAINIVSGISPLVDQTNADVSIRRNALRQTIVPRLREIAPGFETALIRSVRLSALDAEYVDAAAQDIALRIVEREPARIVIERDALCQLHPAVASRVIRIAAFDLLPGHDRRELSEERILSVLKAARGRTGSRIELPYGIVVSIERATLVLSIDTDIRNQRNR